MSNKRWYVSMSLCRKIAFSVCFARVWTVTEPPNTVLWYEGVLWLGCARLCGTGCSWEVSSVITLSNDIDSTVTNRFKQDPAVGPLQAEEGYVPLLCTMEDTFFGSIWRMISPLLTTDDAMMLRTVD